MKKFKIKSLIFTIIGSLSLVACNSGGGSGGNPNPDPTPDPTPTPGNVQPLTITQNIVPTLNKVAGHKIWYMVVKNPNSFSIDMNPWLGTQYSIPQFAYDVNNTSPVNPTKYAMAYDGSISGVTQDCLNYITNKFTMPAGASCAFKFEAQWGINTNSQTNYNFTMQYSFVANGNTYNMQQGCTDKPQYQEYCLANNQNMQVNVSQSTQTANDLAFNGNSQNSYALGNLSAGNRTNYNGTIIWNPTGSSSTNVYSVNYNSGNNTYSMTLVNTYNEYLRFNSAAISLNGNNYYGNVYNQNGLMSNVQSVDANLQWVTGLNNNVYGSNGTTGNIYLLNQSNNTLTNIINATGETLTGVSANGNFLTVDSNLNLYCRLASNGYTKTPINMKGFVNNGLYAVLTNNYYSVYLSNGYYSLNGDSTVPGLFYKVDIDNCQIISNNYMTNSLVLTNSYGISTPDNNNNFYIHSIADYTNGTDGN